MATRVSHSPAPTEPADGLQAVLEIARDVLADLDLDTVLERLVASAAELTGARYAALGVLNAARTELERFITWGMDEETRRHIGALPHGRGVLGELILHPAPLRLSEVGAHPYSYGFPAGHPPMTTFLGVPVLVHGEPFGNLYLTDKAGGEQFSAGDEQRITLLAEFAGVAIDHARRYAGVEAQRCVLRRTVDALDATVQITHAVGGETDLDAILALVAKRGRALVSARAVIVEQELGDQIVIVAGAGAMPDGLVGRSVPAAEDTLAAAALRTLKTLRLEEEPNRARLLRHGVGQIGFHAEAGLVVPLVFRGDGYGALVAVDRLRDGPAFSAEDQRLLEAFAASAATAIATARAGAAERRSQRLAAAEEERRRWARELHDETLQNLAALRLGLLSHLRAADPERMAAGMRDTADALQSEIDNLRALITELRPTALDDLGVQAALEDLAERSRGMGLHAEVTLDLPASQLGGGSLFSSEIDTAVYRITQEALTNARKHGCATVAHVTVTADERAVRIRVRDDGRGFEPSAATSGFGLLGMRERIELLAGTLEVNSVPGQGAEVCAVLPLAGELSRAGGD